MKITKDTDLGAARNMEGICWIFIQIPAIKNSPFLSARRKTSCSKHHLVQIWMPCAFGEALELPARIKFHELPAIYTSSELWITWTLRLSKLQIFDHALAQFRIVQVNVFSAHLGFFSSFLSQNMGPTWLPLATGAAGGSAAGTRSPGSRPVEQQQVGPLFAPQRNLTHLKVSKGEILVSG